MARRAIAIDGIVQGVGFRPFVHAMATRLGLTGFVRNRAGGVLIEVEGDSAALDEFTALLSTCPPPLARIDGVAASVLPVTGDAQFRIDASDAAGGDPVSVAADVATCDECVLELSDARDRRYRHPFVNCTNCGPRLTIVVATPYDRERTSMASFRMCDACRAEYEDAADRRFHAQPVACPECGPTLRSLAADGTTGAGDRALARAVATLRDGGIVAVKGVGGYHLACDARSATAVAELRRRKARDAKPFAVMVADVGEAETLGVVSAAERALLCSPARPIVLLARRHGAPLAAAVAPDSALVGVMLPYAPVHHLLFAALRRPLVMTSGNRSDEPIVCDDGDAIERLGGLVDLTLTHDRAIRVRCDDSVVRVIAGAPAPIRRSRGLAPESLRLPWTLAQPTLAVGGHAKATFTLGEGSRAIPSAHLGDLHDYTAYTAYVDGVAHFERLFRLRPARLVHDLHPDYASTGYARERTRAEGLELVAVQHHHAHMAACLAEHGVTSAAIGVCFDGAGLGADGTIWGGEFLVGDAARVRRAAHLRSVAMPGGERAMREPWRMALSHLREAGVDVGDTPLARRLTPQAIRTIERMIAGGLNAPATSSVGRLFDAIASLVGIADRVSFEGQAAMRLEALASEVPADGAYAFALDAAPAALTVDAAPVVREVVADVCRQVAPAVIARRFHSTVVDVIVTVCRRLRADGAPALVALSGGVFVNAILAAEASAQLEADGFRVCRHRVVPPNDGGLSFGQLAVVAARDAEQAARRCA